MRSAALPGLAVIIGILIFAVPSMLEEGATRSILQIGLAVAALAVLVLTIRSLGRRDPNNPR